MFKPSEYLAYNMLKMGYGNPSDPTELEEFKQYRKKKMEFVLNIIANPELSVKSVCDYGSSSGWFTSLLSKSDISCIEVDDVGGDTAFTDISPVDLVVSLTVLEHQTPDEVIKFLRTAKEKVKYCLIVTNNPYCIFSHYVLFDDITHQRLYSMNSIIGVLKLLGYQILQTGYADNPEETSPRDLKRRVKVWISKQVIRIIFSSRMKQMLTPYNYWYILAKTKKD